MSEEAPTFDLRPARDEDRELLLRVYASTREEELSLVPWTAEEKTAFLQMQFEAQDVYYRQHYTDAEHLVILAGGAPAGRLYINRGPEEIRIVDISLLPEFRHGGLGTEILRSILAEADRLARPVAIHVERNNPALKLYERLGFALAEDKGVYLFLVRRPVS